MDALKVREAIKTNRVEILEIEMGTEVFSNFLKNKKMKTRLMCAMLFVLGCLSAQNTVIFQPSGGANNGNDEGTLTAGKDSWVNRYAPTENNGYTGSSLASPRTNCNESDYKSYFRFDVTNLPDSVTSVVFGVTHFEHTSYCYSNCSADFYFYLCTSAWDEMTLVQNNLPAEVAEPFCGPISISFPNNFGVKEYDITSAYRYWKKNPSLNYGFTIYSPTVGCNNASVYFGVKTSDDVDEANRPYLKIEKPSITGLNQSALKQAISPNPFNDYIKVNISNLNSFYFTNIKGQKIDVKYDSSNQQFLTSHLQKGIYFLHLFIDEKETVVKLIK